MEQYEILQTALAARNTARELETKFTTMALGKGGGLDENGLLRNNIQIDPESDGRPYSSPMLVITLVKITATELIVNRRVDIAQAMTTKDFYPAENHYSYLSGLRHGLLRRGLGLPESFGR